MAGGRDGVAAGERSCRNYHHRKPGFILVLAGLVLLLCGYAYLKALAFPLGYLIFMTPVLDGLD
jgi:hypothetical protein